jgi:ABC-type antimicrobial peptide transport system permease subunit
MMPWTEVAPASALIDAWSLDTRRITQAIGFLATVSLLLAAAGLFAVMAYSVSLRTREMGIRMALGARVVDVRRLVIRQALVLAAVGALAGLAAALPLAAVIRGAFMGISPFDPLALGPVILILFAAAVAAVALPAHRAATADPAKALRAE